MDMNTELRKKIKNNFKKYLFKLINNVVIEKKHEKCLVTTEKRRNPFVSEPNYHATKVFKKTLLDIELKRTQVLTNKLVYLGLSVLEISKIVMYEFWYDFLILHWFHCIYKIR